MPAQLGALSGLGVTIALEVIAEGIETEDQRERLLALGCRYGQGWLFSRAAPPEDIDTRLAEHVCV